MTVISDWPRNRIPEVTRQHVLDTAAELQLRRRQIAEAVGRGDTSDGEIVAHGLDEANAWMLHTSSACAELLSVRPTGTLEQLRRSLPNNRAEIARGLRMTSVFDYGGLDPVARLLLSGEADGCYVFGVAPVQMKLFDDACLVLQGPFVDDEPTVMTVASPDCLDVARRYWQAVLESSFPVAGAGPDLDHLSERQRQILALLASDAKDESIAATLGVSVRTVRTDVAAVLSLLGVRSRFAAGVRVREQVSIEP